MDCSGFHRNLEDYLEGGLDYSGRLGMERHSEQCFRCGQELVQAQELHSMAAGLRSFAAPEGFENAVLQRIRAHESCGRSWSIYQDWMCGIEWGSWRRIAVASSSFAILAFAALYLAYRSTSDKAQFSSSVSRDVPSEVLSEPQNMPLISPPLVSGRSAIMETATAIGTPAAIIPGPLADGVDSEVEWKLESADSEFVEYQIPGPDDRPFVVRLPKTIRMRYGQPSEEYFIRNVSH
jgi:hypothetical protein